MRRIPLISLILFVPLLLVWIKPAGADNVFNALSLQKMEMEQQAGISNLECFPFLENVGTNADEAERVRQCLIGATTLNSALKEIPDAGLKAVGISDRFLRSGGFHTLLVRWDATQDEMVNALRDRPSPEDQKQFIESIQQVKKRILTGLRIQQLYCTFRISNAQCLNGYQTLLKVEPDRSMSRMSWSTVAITDSHLPENDRAILTLKFDDTPDAMTQRLKNDPAVVEWERQKAIYREIKRQYGKTLKALQVPKFFCDKGLVQKECLEGAGRFHEAGKDPGFRKKLWGTVIVHKYNTLIKSDHEVMFRYDLPPEEIIKAFSLKPDQVQIQASVTLAEKLEKRTRNNSTGLRAVCDLVGLQSAHCAEGFKNFIEFVRNHSEYRVARPFTDVMFVDGTQLGRVNFALNSKVRHSYIYVGVHSSAKEMTEHLSRFGVSQTGPK